MNYTNHLIDLSKPFQGRVNRAINRIVIHCTATQPTTPIKNIADYWRIALKWKKPGYHFAIDLKGNIIQLAPLGEIVNGAKGFNKDSIHIAYIGGLNPLGKPADTRTILQNFSLKELVIELLKVFGKIDVCGHRDLSPDKNKNGIIERSEWTKICPCFDVRHEMQNVR